MPAQSRRNSLLAELLQDAIIEIREEGRNLKSKKIEYLADVILTIPSALTEDRSCTSRLVKQALRFRSRIGQMSSHDFVLKARQIRAVEAASRRKRAEEDTADIARMA